MFKKLTKLHQVFTSMTQLYKTSSIIIIMLLFIFSQLLLLVSFFLPLKVLMLLSLETLPFQMFELSRETFILLLVLLGIVVFFLHLLCETMIKKLKLILCKKKNLLKTTTFEYKYMDAFFRTYTTILLIFVLTIVNIFLYNVIGIVIIIYFIIGYIIIHNTNFSKSKYDSFFKIYSGSGFMLIFIVEVFDFLYVNYENISITMLLIVLIVSRYIFTRIHFVLNKLIFLYSSLGNFKKTIKESNE